MLLLFSSCGEEETYLNVYPSSDLHVSASGGEFSFNVDFKGYNDNDCIYVNCAESWVNVKDSFNHYFSLTIQPNPTSMERSAIVEVRDSAWNLSPVRFAIYQSAGPASENGGNNNGGGSSGITAPTNLTASVSGYDITLYWNYSGVADYFHIYSSDYRDSGYEYLGYINGNNLGVILEADAAGTYYFKVTAEKDGMESNYSNIATATVSSSSSGGGNSGGGSSTSKPSAPTNVYVDNYGSYTYPDVRISWSSVSGATGYYVYRSTSAYGSYSKIGTTSNTYYSDSNCKIGNTYYYKVAAYNNAGTSDYSDYCEFEFKDTRKPGPAQYGNCSVSGSTMTLRWSVPSDASFGKPTKALLRVKDPYSNDYYTLQELSGTATSVSFSYKAWVDSDGYCYAGIILENENGSGGGTPKVWDDINKRWMY